MFVVAWCFPLLRYLYQSTSCYAVECMFDLVLCSVFSANGLTERCNVTASYRLRCQSNLSASNPHHFLSAVKESTATPVQRREFIAPVLLSSTFIVLGQVQISPRLAIAEEKSKVAAQEGGTFVDGILSLFDSDQVTKSGKKLPKKYVKSVKEVVKSLRESFNENANDNAKFRRTADSAKEAIQEYLLNWRGSKVVASEVSFFKPVTLWFSGL